MKRKTIKKVKEAPAVAAEVALTEPVTTATPERIEISMAFPGVSVSVAGDSEDSALRVMTYCLSNFVQEIDEQLVVDE